MLEQVRPEHRQPLAGLAPLPSRFLPRRTGKRNGKDGSLLDSSRDRRIFSEFWTTQTDAPCPRWKLITAMNFLHEIKPACQRVPAAAQNLRPRNSWNLLSLCSKQ
jgi:hypothetical protein